MKGHCLLNHFNSCVYLSKCVCEKLKHELIKGWGGESPLVLSVNTTSGVYWVFQVPSLALQSRKAITCTKDPSSCVFGICVSAWWVFLGEGTLISAMLWLWVCVWHRRTGQAGFLWLLFRGCICCSWGQAPCHCFYCYFSFPCSGALCSCRSSCGRGMAETHLWGLNVVDLS